MLAVAAHAQDPEVKPPTAADVLRDLAPRLERLLAERGYKPRILPFLGSLDTGDPMTLERAARACERWAWP